MATESREAEIAARLARALQQHDDDREPADIIEAHLTAAREADTAQADRWVLEARDGEKRMLAKLEECQQRNVDLLAQLQQAQQIEQQLNEAIEGERRMRSEMAAVLQQARQERDALGLRYLAADLQFQQAQQEIERLNSPVLQSEWQKQQAALQQAREALTTYGVHSPGCIDKQILFGKCTCGLDAALKAGR